MTNLHVIEQPWFHLHDGWHFRRTAKGGVQIGQGVGNDVDVVCIMDASGWASIVAHVADPEKELGLRYAMATQLQGGS